MLLRHWRSRRTHEGEALLFVSVMSVRSLADVPAVLWWSSRVRRQIKHSDGALRTDLYALPLRRTFYTRAVWRDQSSIDAFVAAEPHVSSMRALGSRLVSGTFVVDELPAGGRVPSWRRVRELLDRAEAASASANPTDATRAA